MQLDTRLPLLAAQQPALQFQRETQLESLGKIAPAINAMRQLQAQQIDMQAELRKRQAFDQFRAAAQKAGLSGDLGQLAQVLFTHGQTAEHFKIGADLMRASQEEARNRRLFGTGEGGEPSGTLPPARPAAAAPATIQAPASEVAPEMAFGAAGGAQPRNAMMAMEAPTTPAAPAAPTRAGGPQSYLFAGKTYPAPVVQEMLARKEDRPLALEIIKANEPKQGLAGPEIVQLMRARDALPAGSPDRALIQARIDKLNAPSSGVTIQMPVPVYDPKTGQTTYVTREEAIGKMPASAAPKPVDTTQSEEQAATATARLLRRSREISDALKRSPAAEAPGTLEASIQNIPGLSIATNLVRSSDRQIVASAQDDILDALLYLATGAAYNKNQLEQQKSAYLASWSDSAETRAIKRQRLTDMVRDAKIRAGNAWTPELDSQLNLLLESPAIQRQGAGGAAPRSGAAAPAPAPARAGGTRREIAPGVFVTERP